MLEKSKTVPTGPDAVTPTLQLSTETTLPALVRLHNERRVNATAKAIECRMNQALRKRRDSKELILTILAIGVVQVTYPQQTGESQNDKE
jgi:hypothetical protein